MSVGKSRNEILTQLPGPLAVKWLVALLADYLCTFCFFDDCVCCCNSLCFGLAGYLCSWREIEHKLPYSGLRWLSWGVEFVLWNGVGVVFVRFGR